MFTEKPHVLVVDDDARIRSLLSRYLTAQGFIIMAGEDGKQARALLKKFEFDVCVIDVMMPGESGLDLTEWIISTYKAPVLMLTALGDVNDRIKGFEKGADDYLPKPFEPKELVLRLRSLLKRTKMKTGKKEYYIGPWLFNEHLKELKKQGHIVPLTQMESLLLKVFMDHSGEVISREKLAALIDMDAAERAIDVQITRLRKKLEEDSRRPRYLQTVRGKGYMLRI